MAEATFNSKDLEELAQNMYRTAEKLYPKEVKRFLQKEGNKGAGILRKKTRAATKKKTGNLIRGIKRGSVYQYKGSYQVRVKNNAPHAHLIEYGQVRPWKVPVEESRAGDRRHPHGRRGWFRG